jgi:hypothetical protein
MLSRYLASEGVAKLLRDVSGDAWAEIAAKIVNDYCSGN